MLLKKGLFSLFRSLSFGGKRARGEKNARFGTKQGRRGTKRGEAARTASASLFPRFLRKPKTNSVKAS
jgi:hypothetical protein